MELQIKDLAGKAVGQIEVLESVFNRPFSEPLVHQLLVAFQANARSGTKAQKTRAEVSGGGAKPWRQKGTGRARAGSSNSPVWIGGGRAFAAKPRSHAQKLNKKMYRLAMACILSELLRKEAIEVVDSVAMETPKTKSFLEKTAKFTGEQLLIISEAVDNNLCLASRNVPNVLAIDTAAIDPILLLTHSKLVITAPAMKLIEEKLK